ncbi:MAG: ATP-binding cassette domain-containing protein [Bacillota bacterium]
MTLITCEGLTKRYGEVQALQSVSFSVKEGGCIGFLGPNGAGKTTTIRILSGLARPTGGRALVDGLDVATHPDAVQARIGYLAQNPAFYSYMSGQEFLLWVASLFRMEPRAARSRAEELLKRLNLWEARNRAIGGYSGGMKQRLGIAQALINRPKLVFLDEPVSALDPIGRHEILNLIDELRGETTVFMSSHVLADVERVCDWVIIIHKGKVAVEASMAELRQTHALPVFTVEVDPHDPDVSQTLAALPYVTGVRREGPVHRIAVSDLAAARSHLPRAILETGSTLVRYGVEAPTLEDIFLKVVGAQ